MRRILVRGARQLLTLRGSRGPRRGPELRRLGIIEDGSVLIDQGIIREVGPTRRVENLLEARGAARIDAGGMVVMPGFVDCHAHLVSPGIECGSTSLADRLLQSAAAVTLIPGPRLRSEAEDVLQRCSAHGTTTVGTIDGFGFEESIDLKVLRASLALGPSHVRVVSSWFGLQVAAPAYTGQTGRQAEWLCDKLLPEVARRRRIDAVHGACGQDQFTAAECERFLRAANGFGLQGRIDFAAFGRQDPLRSVAQVGPRTVDHLEFAGREDVMALAESNCIAVLLPALAFALDSRHTAPARDLADSGAAIALGSDFRRGFVSGVSMQFVVYLACRTLKLRVEEAITAATVNAAHAVGLGAEVGSIEPGKRADLILLRMQDYRALGCEFGMNLVDMTIQSGIVVHGGTETA